MLQIEGLHDSPPRRARESKTKLAPTDGSQAIVITKLTAGVRDQNRVNVFINGKYALSLDARQVVDLHLKAGQELSEQELQELHQASAFGKLYQRALEWVLMRPRSLQETRNYLKQRQAKRVQTNRQRLRQNLKPLPEIQNDTTALVLERLIERGYIDDYRFTEFYVENRFVKKGISQKRLRLELRKKGIAENIITDVLSKSNRDDNEELMKIVAKKFLRYDREKLIMYLCRQGFHYQDVVAAVEEYAQTHSSWSNFMYKNRKNT